MGTVPERPFPYRRSLSLRYIQQSVFVSSGVSIPATDTGSASVVMGNAHDFRFRRRCCKRKAVRVSQVRRQQTCLPIGKLGRDIAHVIRVTRLPPVQLHEYILARNLEIYVKINFKISRICDSLAYLFLDSIEKS